MYQKCFIVCTIGNVHASWEVTLRVHVASDVVPNSAMHAN